MGKTSIYLSTKAMAYREIEPCARELGMKILILDPKSYRWNDKLEQKFKTFGIADDELEKIKYEIEDYQAIVILKSKKYYGAPEIAPHFAKFDLDPESIHYMRSTNAAKHPVWGDLDATIPPEKMNFLYWIRLDVLDEGNEPALEEQMTRREKSIAACLKPLVERWEPDFDDQPINQWGERWQSLPCSNWLVSTISEAAKDCQIDLFDDGPKLERLGIDSVHMMSSGNLIVTIFGGANGGGMVGGCNLKHYLCLVRKLLEKLVGCRKPFSDSWLIDWDNDCCDDVWTLRLALEPSDETKKKIFEDGYEVLKVEESKDDIDPNVKFVRDFKDYFGYKDEYFPKYTIADVEMSIARECALRQPTDTAAREIEGDAVMLLVLSGDEESVKIGKKLGNCMMKRGKHDQETLLKLMSDAYKRLMHIDSDEKVADEISRKKEDTMKMAETPKEDVQESKLDEGLFGPSGVDYKQMWREFKEFYAKGEDNCAVGFMVNGRPQALVGFVNSSSTLGVKLRAPGGSSYTMNLDLKSFIKEMLSYGFTTSKIQKIEANFEGRGYDLDSYKADETGARRVFYFMFGVDKEDLNKFFTEGGKREKTAKKPSKKAVLEAMKHWASVYESLDNDVEAYIGLGPDEQLGLLMGALCVCPKNGDGARALSDEEIKKYWEWYEKHPVETRRVDESGRGVDCSKMWSDLKGFYLETVDAGIGCDLVFKYQNKYWKLFAFMKKDRHVVELQLEKPTELPYADLKSVISIKQFMDEAFSNGMTASQIKSIVGICRDGSQEDSVELAKYECTYTSGPLGKKGLITFEFSKPLDNSFKGFFNESSDDSSCVVESDGEFKKIDDIAKYLDGKKDLKWINVVKFQRLNAKQSDGGEEIETVGSDGNKETKRTTKKGEWIVNNVSNPDNKWIIDDKTFKKKYEEEKDGIYKPKGSTMLAAKVSDCEDTGVEFAPPNWGGDVIKIKNDGWFMKDPSNEKDIYAISKKDFDSTYKKA